jgi:hypothetical protein
MGTSKAYPDSCTESWQVRASSSVSPDLLDSIACWWAADMYG